MVTNRKLLNMREYIYKAICVPSVSTYFSYAYKYHRFLLNLNTHLLQNYC